MTVTDGWRCICGSGDDGEWHSAMCVASNTPDEVWYADREPSWWERERADAVRFTDPKPSRG